MPQVAIQLPDELSQFVNKTVQAEGYHNADEFLINVLSIYKDQAELRHSESDQEKLESLRRDIQHAAEQLDRGEGTEMNWDEFYAERHRAYAERNRP